MIAKSLKRALPAKLACLCPHPSDSSEGLRLPSPKGQAGEHPWTSPRSAQSSAGLTPQVHTAFISLWHPGEAASEKQSQKRTSASAMPRSLPRGELLQQKHSSNSGEIPNFCKDRVDGVTLKHFLTSCAANSRCTRGSDRCRRLWASITTPTNVPVAFIETKPLITLKLFSLCGSFFN